MIQPIKIFLASSVNEFALERLLLKDFARRLNDVLISYELYIRLFICEFADNEMSDGRMQDTYNHEMDNCDLFLLLMGKRLGQYTLEEYLYAKERFRTTGSPKLMIASKSCAVPDESVTGFLQQLDGTPHIPFENIGVLKHALFESIAGFLPKETVSFTIEENGREVIGIPDAIYEHRR